MKIDEMPFVTRMDLNGLKVAKVIKVKDPKNQERILVRVLGVHEDLTDENILDKLGIEPDDYGIWATHCSPIRAKAELPELNDWVWVMFPNPRNPMFIVWLGFVRYSTQTILEKQDEFVLVQSSIPEKTEA